MNTSLSPSSLPPPLPLPFSLPAPLPLPSTFYPHRGANIDGLDSNFYSPLLAAAAHGQKDSSVPSIAAGLPLMLWTRLEGVQSSLQQSRAMFQFSR